MYGRTHSGISCSVLMGANIAAEVAEGKFSEATIGNARIYNVGKFQSRMVSELPIICRGT